MVGKTTVISLVAAQCSFGDMLIAQTYVGAKVVGVLLRNRKRLRHWTGPIMCVCLTNHALDQFLTNLLDAGVNNIAR